MSTVLTAEISAAICCIVFVCSFRYKLSYLAELSKLLTRLSAEQKKLFVIHCCFFNRSIKENARELYEFVNSHSDPDSAIDEYFNDPHMQQLQEYIQSTPEKKYEQHNATYEICTLIEDVSELIEKKESWPMYSPICWFYTFKYKQKTNILKQEILDIGKKYKIKQKFKKNRLKKLLSEVIVNVDKKNFEKAFQCLEKMNSIGLSL